jgi:hypothetical protein
LRFVAAGSFVDAGTGFAAGAARISRASAARDVLPVSGSGVEAGVAAATAAGGAGVEAGPAAAAPGSGLFLS